MSFENAPVSVFEHLGKQYVVAYSAGNYFAASTKGDSVWLFGLDGTLPPAAERQQRLASVCTVLYLMFNEGYAATSGEDWMRPDLATEAVRLARMLAALAPDEPEVLGLLALLGSRVSTGLKLFMLTLAIVDGFIDAVDVGGVPEGQRGLVAARSIHSSRGRVQPSASDDRIASPSAPEGSHCAIEPQAPYDDAGSTTAPPASSSR